MHPTAPRALSSDPLDIMLRHDAWATRKILEACRPLSHEQFHSEFDVGLRTLHETTSHVLSAMRRWADRVAERPVRPMLHAVPGAASAVGADVKDRSVEELLSILAEAERDVVRVAHAARNSADGLAGLLRLEFEGYDKITRRYTFTKGAALVHLCTHGMHHRAQAHYMLRKLGVTAPDGHPIETGTTEWQSETEAPGEIV